MDEAQQIPMQRPVRWRLLFLWGGYSTCSYSISVETLNMATREGIVCESDGRAYIPASQRPNVKHGNTRRDCVEEWRGIPTSKPAARWVIRVKPGYLRQEVAPWRSSQAEARRRRFQL